MNPASGQIAAFITVFLGKRLAREKREIYGVDRNAFEPAGAAGIDRASTGTSDGLAFAQGPSLHERDAIRVSTVIDRRVTNAGRDLLA